MSFYDTSVSVIHQMLILQYDNFANYVYPQKISSHLKKRWLHTESYLCLSFLYVFRTMNYFYLKSYEIVTENYFCDRHKSSTIFFRTNLRFGKRYYIWTLCNIFALAHQTNYLHAAIFCKINSLLTHRICLVFSSLEIERRLM